MFEKILNKVDHVCLKFKKKGMAEKKPNLLRCIVDNPEDYIMEAYIENEEVIVRIKKKSQV